jgi:hypothetical protein
MKESIKSIDELLDNYKEFLSTTIPKDSEFEEIIDNTHPDVVAFNGAIRAYPVPYEKRAIILYNELKETGFTETNTMFLMQQIGKASSFKRYMRLMTILDSIKGKVDSYKLNQIAPAAFYCKKGYSLQNFINHVLSNAGKKLEPVPADEIPKGTLPVYLVPYLQGTAKLE